MHKINFIILIHFLLVNYIFAQEILKVAIPKHFPPQYQLNENGKPIGFAIDIIEELAKRKNFKIEYIIKETWDETQKVLYTGEADLIPNVGITKDREEQSIFTVPMETFRISTFKRADNINAKEFENSFYTCFYDLTNTTFKEIKIVVVKGNVGEKLAKKCSQKFLKITNSKEDALFSLLSGESDIFIYPEPVVKKMLQDTNLEDKVVIFGKPLKEVKRGIQINKNKPKLAIELDLALKELLESEKYKEIYIKWYSTRNQYFDKKNVILILQIIGIFIISLIIILFIQFYSKRKIEYHVKLLEKEMFKHKKTEEKFKTIFENAQDGLVIVEIATKKFLLANKKMSELLGYSVKEILNLTIEDIHPKDIPNEFEDATNGKTKTKEIMIRKDGSTFNAHITSKKILFEGKECMVGSVRDTTNIEKLQKELSELNKFLYIKVEEEVNKNLEKDNLMIKQSKFAQMGEMISMIAHQWRQPLNVISSAVTNIQIGKELDTLTDKELDDFIVTVQKQTQDMSNTINDFMNFFKPEREREEFQLQEVFENLKKIVEAQFKSRGIEIICNDYKNKNISLFGYKRELEHILLNILSNSRDAFEDKKIDEKNIFLSVLEKEDKIVISIEDNAGGIPSDIIDKIFEPYFTTKEDGKGTGIGLYMTKQMIERNFHGKISVSSNKNGAKFTITLPRAI